MTHYKAVRPDGTSFHDPGFRWLPESGPFEGHVVTHPTANTIGKRASRYLSVSAVATECTGMRWPCRLLEVEPAGEVATPEPDERPNKRAGVAFRVARELPATDALGPQGVQVAALIERSRRLAADDLQRLTAEWPAAWAARDVAWEAATDAARDAARDAAWEAAWEAATDAARDAAWGAAWVARDVALALVVRDLISTEDYDTLTLPWRQTIGPIHPDDKELSR